LLLGKTACTGKLHGNAIDAEQRGALAKDKATTAAKQATRDVA
jgi:hypothetical protein